MTVEYGISASQHYKSDRKIQHYKANKGEFRMPSFVLFNKDYSY